MKTIKENYKELLLLLVGLGIICYVMLKFKSCVEEGFREAEYRGNQKVLVIHRAESGNIIRCFESYNKYVSQTEDVLRIKDTVSLPREQVEVYTAPTYLEGYENNGLQDCYNNKIAH